MIGIRKPALALGLWVLLWSVLPLFTLQAQDVPIKGSRRVATNNWSYQFMELLRERGYLSNLNPLVQPYRAQEVARSLVALDPDTLPEPVAGWVRLLRNEYWREVRLMEGETGPRWGVMAAAGARASTSGRLDVLRPAGTDGDIWPWYNLGGWLGAGPVVGEMRLLGDTYLSDDPDGLDPGQRRGGRTDHAYLGKICDPSRPLQHAGLTGGDCREENGNAKKCYCQCVIATVEGNHRDWTREENHG